MADPTIKIIIDAYTRGLEDGMRRAESSMKSAGASMTAQLRDVGLAIMTVQRLFNDIVGTVGKIYQAGKEGAQLRDLEMRFERISGGAGRANANLEAMRRATKGTVADAELMETAMRLLASGLADGADELEVIAKTVPALGQAFKGFAADRSLLSYTFMIANGMQSVKMRADDFGISVTTVEQRMKELTKAGLEERDALQQAVNEELVRVYEDLGLGIKTAADEMIASEAAAKDFAATVKQDLIPLSLRFAESQNLLVTVAERTWPVVNFLIGNTLAILNALTEGFGKVVQGIVQGGAAIVSVFTGNLDAAQDFAMGMHDTFMGVPDAFRDGYNRIRNEFAEPTKQDLGDVADETEETAQEVSEAFAKIEEAARDMSDAWNDTLVQAAQKQRQQFINELRRAEDTAIETARRMEDIARSEGEATKQARAEAAKARANAARNLARQLIDVERNYQRRIREIQQQYAISAEEAIRSRDALALVRARRQRDRDMSNARRQRDEQRGEAREQYEQQLDEITRALAEQEQAARDSRRKQEEDLRRSLQRQMEDERRHRAREKADFINWLADMRRNQWYDFNQRRADLLKQYAITEADYRSHMNRMRKVTTPTRTTGGKSMTTDNGFTKKTSTNTVPSGPDLGASSQIGLTAGGIPIGGDTAIPSTPSAAVAGGSTIRVQQDFTFQGTFTDSDKQMFRQVAYDQALAAFSAVMEE